MKKIFNCLFLLLIAGTIQAQSILNATGNSTDINGNTYSYSIGEMTLVHTATASNIVVTQGVLQDFNSSVGIETVEIDEDEFKLYPNPTRNVLKLEVNLQEKVDLKLKLYDISGKELMAKEWQTNATNEQKQLNLQSFAAGNYILNVQYQKDNRIAQESYKIQKLN